MGISCLRLILAVVRSVLNMPKHFTWVNFFLFPTLFISGLNAFVSVILFIEFHYNLYCCLSLRYRLFGCQEYRIGMFSTLVIPFLMAEVGFKPFGFFLLFPFVVTNCSKVKRGMHIF